ncbi:guanylate kinase [Porphyromonas crevioricanis]|uniref:Guanylate kinase n=2 Tax=Porphyromonas crevioricanis TaxID=393921 RepID=A0AB34PHM5_9PORP|nr:guanylate kinase [Porphyromonas crevioricanis]KGN89635.1 guanylate kinase [Porphyromonas crevioricanis]KGN96982.1 guanylate kinase [Porphyromonas crevioricanis]SKA00056.1 guanylate kinase [Porphyromonas crevioricanis]
MSSLIIFAAPSGTGKSTVIKRLMRLAPELNLSFSISATSRKPRGDEQHGVEYYFLSPADFRAGIEHDAFLEYEEVYTDTYYGTLREEVDRRLSQGQTVVFDVDVVGAMNIKEQYADKALSIFLMPPSIETLRQRLTSRATDSPKVIEERLAKAEYEMSRSGEFDLVVVNDDLDACTERVLQAVCSFVQRN